MTRIWSDEGKLAAWLEVELAATAAWSELGVVPRDAADRLAAAAAAPSPQRVAELEATLHHDTAAFVDAVAETLGEEGRWFHYGLTSSDVVDTALSLQIRGAGALILAGIDRALGAVVARAEEHRGTLQMGRTHGVHAEPTTFGLKLAGWAFELDRARGGDGREEQAAGDVRRRMEAGELEQDDHGREPEREHGTEARPGRGESGRDERAAECVAARPRHVERHDVHAVAVEGRPVQPVAEDDLDGDRREPGRDPARGPRPPRAEKDEQEGDDHLPGQRHYLRNGDPDPMPTRVQEGHDRLEQRRRRAGLAGEGHRVLDGPPVEPGRRS